MKAQELRIGNWVNLNNCPKKIIWVKYNSLCVMNEYPSAIVALDRSEPIPLTEEILLKCGFVKEFKGCYSDKNRFVIFENIYNNVVGLVNSDLYYSKVNGVLHLKHLHQLQNLYFALTGEELEVEF